MVNERPPYPCSDFPDHIQLSRDVAQDYIEVLQEALDVLREKQ